MQKQLCKFAYTLSGLFLLTSQLSAQDEPERERINTRPMTLEQIQVVQDMRSQEATEEQEEGILSVLENISKETKADLYYYPIDWHWVNNILEAGALVEFEDGSQWRILGGDVFKTRGWRASDALILTPNTGCFASSSFYITNKATGAYVKADIYNGPLVSGPYTHYVSSVDTFNGHVILENGITFCISGKDTYLLNDWALGDPIILGVNDGWFTTYKSFILNVRTLNYVRAKIFN